VAGVKPNFQVLIEELDGKFHELYTTDDLNYARRYYHRVKASHNFKVKLMVVRNEEEPEVLAQMVDVVH
jgi:hypothetical protein